MDGLKRQRTHSQGHFAAITAMAAGRVGCGDGALSCIFSMGLMLMGYGCVPCGLGRMFWVV